MESVPYRIRQNVSILESVLLLEDLAFPYAGFVSRQIRVLFLTRVLKENEMNHTSKLCRPQVLLLLTLLLLVASNAFGQSARGVITGEVKDSSGAIVPGAEEVIVNKANGTESKTVSTNTGLYRIPYVEPGTYKISVSLKGFKTAVRDNVNLLLAQ